MSANHRDVYLMRGADDSEVGTDGWLVPEPADEVIVQEIVDSTDRSRDDIEPLSENLDFGALQELLAGDSEETDELVFSVDGVEVTVAADGSVAVSD